MTEYQFFHFTDSPGFDMGKKYKQRIDRSGYAKPSGLWVSKEVKLISKKEKQRHEYT